MKIQVAKQDLDAALQVASCALGSGGPDSVAAHYVFRVQKNKDDEWGAEVLSYSGERLSAAAPFISKVEITDEEVDAGYTRFTIEGSRLKDLIRLLPDEALVFEYDGKRTAYKGPSASEGQHYGSLNPKGYPWWDATLDEAEVTATVPAESLRRAFSWAKLFVLDDDSRRPDLCIFECRSGIIYATNTRTVALITVPGLEESSLRVYGDNAPKLVSFLAAAGETNIEVMEAGEKALFLRRHDGAIFQEARHSYAFPKDLKLAKIGTDPHTWEFKTEDLAFALAMHNTVADKANNAVRFLPLGKGEVSLEISRVSDDGIAKRTLKVKESSEKKAVAIPDKGFMLDRNELGRLLSFHEEKTLTLGIHPRPQSGFVRVAYGVEGVECQVILAWLRE